MPENNPATDAELAEVKRLLAAAKMPARLYAITRPREAWEGIKVYEVDTGGEPHWFALCLTRERAEYTEAALNAFPAILARLEAAERERDRWKVAYAEEFSGPTRQAADSQQRREGAVAENDYWADEHEGLLGGHISAAHVVRAFNLREGGE